jgi:hypothetical protein
MLVSSRYLPRFRVDPLAAIFYRLLHLANGLRVDRTSKAEKVSTRNPFGCCFDEAMDELRGLHLHLGRSGFRARRWPPSGAGL